MFSIKENAGAIVVVGFLAVMIGLIIYRSIVGY